MDGFGTVEPGSAETEGWRFFQNDYWERCVCGDDPFTMFGDCG